MSLELNHELSLVCAAFGVASFLFFTTGATSFRQSVLASLEFWTAGGIIRLSGHPNWLIIAGAAVIIVVRKFTSLAIPG